VLRAEAAAPERPLIVAHFVNFAEISASVPVEDQRALAGQIAGRLTLGNSGNKLFQGDAGVFAWFADDEMAISLEDHLNALHNIFRSPVRIGDIQLDLAVAFGVEGGSDRSTGNRLGSALLAAEEAAAAGQRWKLYDTARLKDAPWRLSILSQLDTAIASGDLWVAYQPKFDLRTRQITGAEALVRWSHPEKGPISPADFVPAAEQSGRIKDLTAFVLDEAIGAASTILTRVSKFEMAVNLSARLIDDPGLQDLVFGLLAKHDVPPGALTLEITETAALGTGEEHLARLADLRKRGVRISIDDYGTGLSTLEYLRRIPADEIKIDRSFVEAMHRSEGDRVIIESTISLGHSLGRRIVAEGVESLDALNSLGAMGCDVAQGFFVGRPMPWQSLERQLQNLATDIIATR
jgi:EAL domain-containing protein (putative c-di-GMP-specific phosphodiesterase class I)